MLSTVLDTTFAALSDPTRRAVLARLALEEATVNELAEPFAMTLPAFTKHLKVLEKAGLIEKRRDAQFRRCSLKATPLREARDWLNEYRAQWEARLDRMEAYARQLHESEEKHGRKSR